MVGAANTTTNDDENNNYSINIITPTPQQKSMTTTATGSEQQNQNGTMSLSERADSSSRSSTPQSDHNSTSLTRPSPSSSSAASRLEASRIRRDAQHEVMRGLGLPVVRGPMAVAEKTAQRDEAAATRQREWITGRGANMQKHDQLNCSKGKWGKVQHKLLPR